MSQATWKGGGRVHSPLVLAAAVVLLAVAIFFLIGLTLAPSAHG